MPHRRITPLQAACLNMAMMVGVGPFITIPDFVASLGGPQAMLGWLLGALVAIADGLVWCELAAAYPGSGGTYHFFDAILGGRPLGRLLKFLFVWQFLVSSPLELASGAVGLGQYAGYLWSPLNAEAWRVAFDGAESDVVWRVSMGQIAAVGATAFIVLLAYRRVEAAGRLMVVLWAGMILTVGWVIIAGLTDFHAERAFAFPPGAFEPTGSNIKGLGVALGIAMYDFFGYYQVCYMGDEVVRPERTLPKAILISVLVVAAIYLTMNVGILGVLGTDGVIGSRHIATDFMQRRYGASAATLITVMILWTGIASSFSGMLGYSRVPYAAARAGHFFAGLAKSHPTGDFPHRSLILVGALTAAACLFDLPTIIGALLASRVIIQFVGQIVALAILRSRPGATASLPFRMPLYPLPALFALAGWCYVFLTLPLRIQGFGLLTVALGAVAFGLWTLSARRTAIRTEANAPDA